MKNKSLFASILGFCLFALIPVLAFLSCEVGLGEAVDVAAPLISIKTPETSSIIRDTFAIAGDWSDDGSIKELEVVLRNTGTNKEYEGFKPVLTLDPNSKDAKGTWSATIDPAAAKVPDGNYEATITITDNGRHSTEITRTFVIDNTAPVMVLSRPSSSNTDADNLVESYGQYLTLEGQAADDNDIEKIVIQFFSKNEPDKLLFTKEITSIPPTISLDVAKFLDDDVYSNIYGDEKAGEKYYYCTITAYDSAKRYPLEGQELADDDLGNAESSYILWSDWEKFQSEYQKISGGSTKLKVPDLYSIKAGKSADGSRTAAQSDLIDSLFEKAIPCGSFKLNPENSPTFSISGLELGSTTDVENERALTVQLAKGLDGLSLLTDDMKVYLIPVSTDASGKEVLGKKIYPQTSEFQKKGDGQFLTKIIKEDNKDEEDQAVSLEYGKVYIIGVDGKDIENNKILPSFTNQQYYIKFKAKNVAPGLTITTPSPATTYLKKGQSLTFSGSTSVPDGYPTISITCKKGEETTARTVYTYKVTEADRDKYEGGLIFYNFEFTVPIDGTGYKFDQTNSDQYIFDITADLEDMPTTRSKTVIYDIDGPTISIDSMLPTAEKFKLDADGDINEEGEKVAGEFLNGDVTMKIAILDDYDAVQTMLEAGKEDRRPYFIIEDAATGQEIPFTVGSETQKTTKHLITTPAKQSFVIHTKDIADGNQSRKIKVKIFAQDRAGNLGVDIDDLENTAFEREYTVDQTTDVPVILPYNAAGLTLKYSTVAQAEAALADKVYKSILTTGSDLLLSIKDDDGIKFTKFFLSEKNTALPSNATPTESQELQDIPSDYNFRYTLPTISGRYECKIIIEDKVGNKNTKDFWIIVTGAAPQVSISSTSPDNKTITLAAGQDNIEAGAKTQFTNTIEIESGYTSFKVSRFETVLNNGVEKEQETVLYGSTEDNWLNAHSFTDIFIPAVNRATNRIRYVVADEMGKTGEREFVYYLDSQKPVISADSIIVPTNRQTESSSFKFEAATEDASEGDINAGYKASGVSKIQYTFDSSKAQSTIKEVRGVTSLNEKIEFADPDFAYVFGTEGAKTIYIRAIDDVGNIGNWISKGFMYDTKEPALNIASYKRGSEAEVSFAPNVAAKSFDSGDEFSLSGTVSDNTGIQTFEIWQNDIKLNVTESIISNGTWTITGLPRNPDNLDETLVESGTFVYTIKATDKSDFGSQNAKTTSAEVTVSIDKTAPTVSIALAKDDSSDSDAYGENSLKGNAYTFRGEASDAGSGFDKLYYAFTRAESAPASYSLFVSPSTNNWSIPMNLATGTGSDTSDTLHEGKRYLYVKGVDKAGNWSEAKHVAFMVDQADPVIADCKVYKDGTIETSAASDGIVYLNAVTAASGYKLKGRVSDANGISKLTVDGTDVTVTDGIWETEEFTSQGNFTHTIIAYDNSGKTFQTSKSTTITSAVMFDTTAPQASVADFDKSKTTKVKWLNGTGDTYINGTASDVGAGLDKLEIKVDTGDYKTIPLSTNWSYKYSIPDDFAENDDTDDSHHTVTVKATDKAKNSKEYTYYFRYDKTAPSANLTLNKNGGFVNGVDLASVTLSGYAYDNQTTGRAVKTAKITVKKDGSVVDSNEIDLSTLLNETAGNDFGNFSTGLDTSKYSDGLYVFTLEVKDKADNSPAAGSSITASMTVDKTLPVVNATSFTNWNSTNSGATINVTFTETNPDYAYYYIDDRSTPSRTQNNVPETDWVSMNINGNTATKSCTFNDGKGKVYIKVVDKAGNEGFGTALDYEVDTKAPDVCTLGTVDGAALSGSKLINGSNNVVFTVNATDYNDNRNTSGAVIGADPTRVASVKLTKIGDTTYTGNAIVSGTATTLNGAKTGVWTITIPSSKFSGKTSGSFPVTVTVTDTKGNSKDFQLFTLDIDQVRPTLNSYALESSYDAGLVSSVQTFYMNNTRDPFTLTGVAKDDREIEEVKLTIKNSSGTTVKTLTSSDSAWTFTSATSTGAWTTDWVEWTDYVTVELSVKDKAQNVVASPTTFKIIFDTTAPEALHKKDNSGKDIYFRVGDQDRDDGSTTTNGTTTWTPVWSDDLDKDVGGKYTPGTFGNKETIKIRGNFDESGSGIAMIYYQLYTTEPPNETQINSFVADPAGEATGYFSPKAASETSRRVFYTGNVLTGGTALGSTGKFYKEIASTYLTTISDFKEGHNYLVLVAVDNVGNAAVDNISGNYYTINVDTQAPETAAMTEDVYTAATSALKLAFTVTDNPSGANAVQAGIKSVKVKMNGVADEYPATLNSEKYEVTIPQNKLPTVSNTYSVSVTAVDNAGNSDTRNVGSVIVDRTPPSMRVTSTAGWVKNSIENASVYVYDSNGLKKNAADKEFVTYNVYLSTNTSTSLANGTIEVDTTKSEASINALDVSSLQNGKSYIIRFTAEDIVGNKSYVNTEAYTIDRTGPEINNANSGVGGTNTVAAVDATDKWFNATTLTVSGKYTDGAGSLTTGSGVTRINYTLKKANNTQVAGSWATTNGSYEANLDGFVVGTNTLELKAVDAMGNESATTTKYTVKVDTSKPSVTSGHTSTLYSNGSGSLTINATISDTGSGIQSVVLSREGSDTTVNMTNGSGDSWSANALSLISGLNSGTVTIAATATDKAGNETKVAVASVMVDKAGPTIKINSPASNAKTASTVTVSGTASDGNGAGVDTTTGLTLYYTTNSTVGASAPTSSTIGTAPASKWVAYTIKPTLDGQNWTCSVDTSGFTTANANTPVYFAVGGKDTSGTGNDGYSLPLAVSVDRMAPAKTLFNVDGKAENTVTSTWFNKTTLKVNGTFTDTDGSGVASILYVLDSGTEKEIPTTDGTYNTNIDGFTTGSHTLKVRAKDAAGNYSSYNTYTVKVDDKAPVIEANYTGVIYADASSCPVELTVTDQGNSTIDSVTLTVGENAPVACSLVNGKYTKDIISLLEDGTVSVTATATDKAGNTTSRVIANVMLDTTGPELTINTPGANAKTSSSFTVSGSASDGTGSGINKTQGITVYYTKTDSVGTVKPTAGTISSWTAYTVKPTLIGQSWVGSFDAQSITTNNNNTTLYLCVGAVDTSGSGNPGYSEPVTIVVDRKAPASTSLTIDETTGSTLTSTTTKWFNNTTVNLHGTFTDTDGSGVASVKYAVKKSGASDYAAEQTIASDGEYTANVKGLAAGTNTIKVWAVDTAGNASTPTEYTVKVDDKAPAISADYTGVIYADAASCPVELNVTDQGGSNIDTVTLTVGDKDPVPCTLSNGKYTYDIKNLLVDGTVSVTATAKDKAGNETSRVIANVMLDTTGPTLEINTPGANAKTSNSFTVSGSASDGTGSGINNAADKGITLYYTTSSTVKANSPTTASIGTTPASKWVAYGTKPTLSGQTWTGTFNVPDAVAASGSNQTLYICVGAVDKSGSGNPGYSEPVTIVVDRKAPSIASSGVFVDTTNVSTLGSSTTKWFNNTTVNLNGTFTDDGSGVASIKYQLKKGSGSYGSAQTLASDGAFSTNIKDLAAGTNTIKVWAVDTAGNESTAAEYTVKVDAETPVISAAYTGVIYADASSCPVELTVTDGGSSGIASVTLTTDEGSVNCTKNTTTGKYEADVQSILPQGTASVTATATDNAGNSTSRVIANVMKDTSAPTVVINTPSANAKTSSTISLSGSASDGVGSGIKESEGITLYYTKTAAVGTVTPTASTISSWTAYGTKMNLTGQTWSGSFTVPTTVAPDDANTTLYLCVGAVDNAGTGNKGYSSPVTVVVDKAKPAKSSFKVGTTLESAVNTTWFNNETLNINGSFTDAGGSGVSAILYKLDSGTEQEIPTTDGTFNTNIAGFETGTHTLVVRAKDKVGNYSGSTSYTIKVDMSQPVISEVNTNDFKQIILSNGTLAKTFSFDVSDTGSGIATAASSVTAKVGSKTITSGSNGSSISVAAESNGKNRVTVTIGAADLTTLQGNNSVIVTVADQAGNQSNSQSIGTISMDKDAPVPNFTSHQANATVNKTITLAGRITDTSNSEITAVTLKANNSLTFTQVASDNENAGKHGYLTYANGQWTATLDTTKLYNDTGTQALSLSLTATDKADNTTETAVTLALTIDQNSDRPVVKFTNLVKEGTGANAKYILKYGNAAALEGTITDDDATSAKVVKTFIASSSPITSATATPTGTTTFNAATGDYTFTPASPADGAKTVYFYIVDNNDNVFYTTQTTQLTRPYKQYKTDIKEDNAAAITYNSDSNAPLINSVQLQAYTAATGATQNGTLTALGTNCVVGGTSKNYVDLKVSAKDANGVKGIVIKVEQGSRVTYYRSNNSVAESDDTTYADTGTVEATTDDTSNHVYTTSRINITNYVNGQVTVTVKVYDNSGLYNNQESVFVIDRDAPTLSIDNNVAEGQVVYGINKITIGGSVTATDVDKIYYAVTNGTTASNTIAAANWIEVEDQKISAQVIFGGSQSDAENGKISDTLRKWMQTVYSYDDAYMTEHDENKPLTIHFKAVDACGNAGYSSRTVSVVPNGDKPVITLSYPVDKAQDVHPSLAGTIRIYGNAEVITGNVAAVYVQIDTDYDGTFDETGWETGFNNCKEGKNTSYTVEQIGNTTMRGIKAVGTDNWNLPINANKEFNPVTGGTSETRRMAIRIYGVGGSGKVSEPVIQEFTIDPNAPHIGGTGADTGVMQLKLVQFASGTPLTDAMTYTQAQTAISNQMPYVPGQTVWVKGQWYIAASVYDDSGIASIKLDENITGIDPIYLVDGGNIKSNLAITTSQATKTIFVKANDCKAAINNVAGKKNFDIYIPLPTSAGSGSLTFTLEAVEASEFNNGSTETVKVNFDNTPPKLGTAGHENYNANAYNVQQDNGFYRLFGYATDAEGGNLVSDMKAVAFYFVRRGTAATNPVTKVYDPMWKDKSVAIQTGTTNTTGISYEYGMFWNTKTVVRNNTDLSILTLTTKDDNIHAGGFVLIGGTIYTIRSVSSDGLTITLKTDAPAGITQAKFAYAMVIDNFNMTESTDTREKITNSSAYGYGYYAADSTADDGDLMRENWASGKWEAWINSANIPDGPIEIHYVALDNAQNYSVGIVGNLSLADYQTKTTLDVSANGTPGTAANNLISGFDYIYNANKKAYVSNNAPRIAGVTVGTDYNGNGTVEASEKQTKYVELGTRVFNDVANTSSITKVLQQFNASSDGTASGLPFMRVVDKTSVEMEIIGGNNEMYYRYHITENCDDTATFINGTYGTGNTSWQVTRTTDEGYKTDDDGHQGYYTTTKLPAIDFTADQLKTAIGGDSGENGTRWWTIQIWDSTEETTHFENSQYAELKLPLNVEVLDKTRPNTVISPLYWKSSSDNSVYKNANNKLLGHIELKSDLETGTGKLGTVYGTDDDKISGIVTFSGYAYDNKRLAKLKWGIKDKLTGNILQAWPQQYVDYSVYTAGSGWSAPGSETLALPYYYFKVYDDASHGAYLDERGHKVYWELTIDTSRVQEPGKADDPALGVGKDLYVYVWAEDSSYVDDTTTPNNKTNLNPTVKTDGTDAENISPNYKVDVLPYIKGVKTRLATKNKKNPEVYSRTAKGHYPIASDETEVILQGFNLAAGNADVNISSIIASSTTGAYAYTIPGTTITTINNMNNNNAHGAFDIANASYSEETKVLNMYNRTPSTVTNLTLNDDVYFDMWEFKKAATVKSGKINEPVMRINPTNQSLGFAFANGADSLSLPSARTQNGTYSFASYTNWQYNYANYAGINFVYDTAGTVHSISTGLDTEPSGGLAGYMQYINSGWGGNGNNMYNWNAQRTLALESVGIPSGVYVNGTALTANLIDVDRFGKPAFAVAGTNRAYLAYYDGDNNQIRFRYGSNLTTTRRQNGRTDGYGQFSDDKAAAGTIGHDTGGGTYNSHTMFEAHTEYYSLLAGKTQGATQTDTGNGTSEFVALDVIAGANAAADVVVIVWYDGSDLMYTYRYGTKDDTDCSSAGVANKWSEPQVIFEGVGQYCTIKVDKNNGIHIAAYSRSGADLYYCYMSGYDQYANRKTALVDSYSQVGKYISLDTALVLREGSTTAYNVVPYITYYGDGYNGLPKLAYLPGGINSASPDVPDGATDEDDMFTGSWEVSVIPTASEVNEDNMNIALWKTNAGVLTNSTKPATNYTEPTITAAGTNTATWYGNGTSKFVLGYGITANATGFIEIGQMKN